MKERYDGKWYKTLTFRQETIRYLDNVADTSIWYEAVSIPGRLRIDIAPVDSGNGLVFVDDHRYVFQRGRLVFERPEIHPLLVLGFDVYHLPAAETLARLDSIGVDLSVLHEEEWQGRPVYVVGALQGDLRPVQFWIDRERLYFVRLLQPASGGGRLVDIRFEDYRPAGEAWVAPTVEFHLDEKLMMREVYQDIRIDEPVSDSLFNPVLWQDQSAWVENR